MSKRYIDADALLEALPDDLPYKASVKRVLIQAPAADVVEVVRCRECKHYQNDIFSGGDGAMEEMWKKMITAVTEKGKKYENNI